MSLRLFCILTLPANGISLESESVSDLAVFPKGFDTVGNAD